MLVKLTGIVDYQGDGFVIIEQGGLGHKVNVPEEIVFGLTGNVSLYLHEVLRDDARELFGFFSMDALELFWKLLSVSGVGARSAQKIVYTSSVEDVKASIMKADLAFLTSISGIGKKTAQKIILELSGALAEEPVVPAEDTESVEALMSLGYSRKQAQEVLAAVDGDSVEERVRAALKTLAV